MREASCLKEWIALGLECAWYATLLKASSYIVVSLILLGEENLLTQEEGSNKIRG